MDQSIASGDRASAVSIVERHPWIVALVLGFVTLGVFWPATFNGFVNFDDGGYVEQNSKITGGISWAAIRWAFTTGEMCNWHPLTWMSHMLDCQLFGLNPWGHHLTSVLIHAVSTALLFLVLLKLTRNLWPSLLVAAIFGLHPTRVESVAWVSERKDVLAALFWILTIWAYSKWTGVPAAPANRARNWYWICLGIFTLGLLSKPMLVTLPCVLLLLDLWPLGRYRDEDWRSLVVEKLPFLALVLISSTITIIVQQEAMASIEHVPMVARVENALLVYCRYFGQLFWPANLAVLYPRPKEMAVGLVALAGLFLAAVSLAAVIFRGRRPYFFVGWFWYLGTLVPVIGIIQVGSQAMADRYTYIPTIGLLVAIAWAIQDLVSRSRRPAIVWGAVIIPPVVVCAFLTTLQIPVWRNGGTLFHHTIKVTEKHPTPYHNLGTYHIERGEIAEGLPFVLEAVRLGPNHADARHSYGMGLLRLGKGGEAVEQFSRALTLRPGMAKSHRGIAAALSSVGRAKEALEHFAEAVRLEPENATGRQLYAEALVGQNQVDAGIAQYREALRLQPKVGDSYFRLAQTLQSIGKKTEATGVWREGLNVAPNDITARNNLGALLAEAGRMADAAEQFRAALRIDPTNADAKYNLEAALAYLAKQGAK